jgi:hypothetical protein
MIGKINLEPAILSNFIYKYQQLKLPTNSQNNNNTESNSSSQLQQQQQQPIVIIKRDEAFSPDSNKSPADLFLSKAKRTNSNTTTNNTFTSAQLALKNLRKSNKDMSTTTKLKSIWFSIFQAQNPSYMVQKSIKHVDNSVSEDSSSSNDYRRRREKNNESVRKSRAKNRNKIVECAQQVQELHQENKQLNRTLANMQSELFTLKGLFQHCFSFNLNTLAIKPNDIPTSTLYKMIMKKDAIEQPSLFSSSIASIQQQSVPPSAAETLNETDIFYINQIKNALSSISKSDMAKSSSALTPPTTPPLVSSPVTSTTNSIDR